jgi:methyl-accepting chemotaxis protein
MVLACLILLGSMWSSAPSAPHGLSSAAQTSAARHAWGDLTAAAQAIASHASATSPEGGVVHVADAAAVVTAAIAVLDRDTPKGAPANKEGWPEAALSAWGGSARTSWAALPSYLPVADTVRAAATRAAPALTAAVAQAAPAWRAAATNNGWADPAAVNLAQTLAAFQEMSSIAASVIEGGDVPARLGVDRQNVESALRTAASNPEQPGSDRAQVWQVLAAAFAQVRPDLDTMIGNAQAWNAVRSAAPALAQSAMTVWADSAWPSKAAPQVAPATSRIWPGVLGAVLALLSLAALTGWAWAQNRWAQRSARATGDGLRAAVDTFRLQLQPIASGNLSAHLDPGHPALAPIASTISTVLKQWRRLIGSLQKAAAPVEDGTSAVAQSITPLIDIFHEQSDRLGRLASSAAPLPDQANTIHQALLDLGRSLGSLDDVSARGRQAATDALARWQSMNDDVRAHRDQAVRVAEAVAAADAAARDLDDVADQLSVLAIQAAVQAAKAGEAGHGFAVVADAMHTLSERGGVQARAAAAQARAAAQDGRALAVSWRQSMDDADAGTKLLETVVEAGLSAERLEAETTEAAEQARASLQAVRDAAPDLKAESLAAAQAAEQTRPFALSAAQSVSDLQGAMVEWLRANEGFRK